MLDILRNSIYNDGTLTIETDSDVNLINDITGVTREDNSLVLTTPHTTITISKYSIVYFGVTYMCTFSLLPLIDEILIAYEDTKELTLSYPINTFSGIGNSYSTFYNTDDDEFNVPVAVSADGETVIEIDDDKIKFTLLGDEIETRYNMSFPVLETVYGNLTITNKGVLFSTELTLMNTDKLLFKLETIGYMFNKDLLGLYKINGTIEYEMIEKFIDNGFETKTYIINKCDNGIVLKHKLLKTFIKLNGIYKDDIVMSNLNVLFNSNQTLLLDAGENKKYVVLYIEDVKYKIRRLTKDTYEFGLHHREDKLFYNGVKLDLTVACLVNKGNIYYYDDVYFLYRNDKFKQILIDDMKELSKTHRISFIPVTKQLIKQF